jgi:hypothetical protein
MPNQVNQCDYFVHYYQVDHEAAGRSGAGGTIRPDDILLLEKALMDLQQQQQQSSHQQPLLSPYTSTIHFVKDTNDTFWERRGDIVHQVRTTRNSDGTLVYWPYADTSLVYPTGTDNVLKMWHSQQSVWELLDSYATQHAIHYDRVMMLRSDVFFVTPLDIFRGDIHKVLIPGFASFPVNDRMVAGPMEAVRLWASSRFALMEKHATQTIPLKDPGFGIHSERFLYHTLFPTIQHHGFAIQQDFTICFLRARSDGTLWATDCAQPLLHMQAIAQSILHTACRLTCRSPGQCKVIVLDCTSSQRTHPDEWITHWLPAWLWNPPWKNRVVYEALYE